MKKIPFSLCGLMLGILSLGNLLQGFGEIFHTMCGVVGILLGILWIIRNITQPVLFFKEMNQPVTASIAGTFCMSLMLLSVYAKLFFGPGAIWIWYLGVLLHCVLIIWFTVRFMIPPVLEKVYASYFVVYVGIAAAAIAAPAFEMNTVGMYIFKFGFTVYFPLLCIIIARYIKCGEPTDGQKPLFCIYAAPLSLCLTGYLQVAKSPNPVFVAGVLLAAQISYVIAVRKMLIYMKLSCIPAFASFTFPTVISAIAMRKAVACLAQEGIIGNILDIVGMVEVVIAVCVVVFVSFRFIQEIIKKETVTKYRHYQ